MTHSDPPPAPNPSAADAGARTGAKTVRIAEDRDGQRIDNFLLGYLKGAPRSLIYKLLRSGQVRVNGGRVKAERKRSALTELQSLMREDGGRAAGIRKRYLALLTGRMPDGVMSVHAALHVGLRQGGERHVQVVTSANSAAGKASTSHFQVLER